MQYGFSRIVDCSFEKAVETVTEELKKEGFGVLTTIDVKETLKNKLNVDFRKYLILGACNPPFAHKALSAEINMGLLMPCNVVVYENDQKETVVALFDPSVMTRVVDTPGISELAAELKGRLERVFGRLP